MSEKSVVNQEEGWQSFIEAMVMKDTKMDDS